MVSTNLIVDATRHVGRVVATAHVNRQLVGDELSLSIVVVVVCEFVIVILNEIFSMGGQLANSVLIILCVICANDLANRIHIFSS